MTEKQLVFFWHNEKKVNSSVYYLQLKNTVRGKGKNKQKNPAKIKSQNFSYNEDNSKGISIPSSLPVLVFLLTVQWIWGHAKKARYIDYILL